MTIGQLEKRYEELQNQIKMLQEESEYVRDALITNEHKLKSYEVVKSERKIFNSKKFRKDNPDTYNEYLNTIEITLLKKI